MVRGMSGWLGMAGAAAGLAGGASGQWSARSLQGEATSTSQVNGGWGGDCAGAGLAPSGLGGIRAMVWSGAAGTWVDLHPTWAVESMALAVHAATQVGYASVTMVTPRACLWRGSAGSWTDLNPPGWEMSYATGVWGDRQVGVASLANDGVLHAILWRGTAGSFMDLNPAGAVFSIAEGVWGEEVVGTMIRDSGGGLSQAAVLWRGSAASAVSLHPTGWWEGSRAHGASDGSQVGIVVAPGGGLTHAAMWHGTAGSFVDLGEWGETSWAQGAGGGLQVGWVLTADSWTRASVWSGSAGSRFDLESVLPGNYHRSRAMDAWTDGALTRVGGWAENAWTGRLEAIVWTYTPLGVYAADFNGDGFVDYFDYDAFVGCLEGAGCPEGRTADFNGDGFTDYADYAAFVEAFESGV